MIYVKLAGLLAVLFFLLFAYSFFIWAFVMSGGGEALRATLSRMGKRTEQRIRRYVRHEHKFH